MAPQNAPMNAAALRRLRQLGRARRAMLRIGKADVSDGVVRKLGDLLDEHELVKVKALESAASPPGELADRLGAATGATVAAVVGRTVLLYRPNPELPPEKRIRLA